MIVAALDLTTGLSLVGLIVMVVFAVAAAAWAVMRANLATNTIVLLQANADAERQRADRAEHENKTLQITVATMTADMDAVKVRLANAEEMASGTKAIGDLRVLLERQHGELLVAIGGK